MKSFPLILLSAWFAMAASAAGQTNVQVAQLARTIDRWVDTKHLISEEQADWKQDEVLLQDTLRLLEQERRELTEEVEALRDSAQAWSERTADSQAERDKLQQQLDEWERLIRGAEARMRDLVAFFPPPLEENLSALIVNLPQREDTFEGRVGERYLTVLGLLTEAEKFNAQWTLEADERSLPDGSGLRTTTIYWGLAGAWSIDEKGERCFFGSPQASGEWSFSEVPIEASIFRRFVDMAEGNTDEIAFVDMPIELAQVAVFDGTSETEGSP